MPPPSGGRSKTMATWLGGFCASKSTIPDNVSCHDPGAKLT